MVDTDGARPEAAEVFPPTLREVMLRPRWLAMLAFCLVVAGVFAWLGQWQLGRALDTAPIQPGQTEQVQPLADVVAPGAYLQFPQEGQRVTVSGRFVAGDFLLVSNRMNDGVQGYWVTGQLRVADTATPTSVAVAVGWARDREKAEAAAARLNKAAPDAVITGRAISDEGAQLPPSNDPWLITSMSPAALLSRWHDIAGLDVYRPFIASQHAMGGLTPIASHPPQASSGINWLNLFYAAEWAVFAGFAFYLWYRLARDEWEKEREEIAEAQASGSDGLTGGPQDPSE